MNVANVLRTTQTFLWSYVTSGISPSYAISGKYLDGVALFPELPNYAKWNEM